MDPERVLYQLCAHLIFMRPSPLTEIGLAYVARTGLLPPPLGATCGSVWTQTRLDHRIFDHGGMLSWLVLCAVYVRFDLTAITIC